MLSQTGNEDGDTEAPVKGTRKVTLKLLAEMAEGSDTLTELVEKIRKYEGR